MSTRKYIVGGMTADPELKFSQAGKAWVTFRVGSSDGKGDDGKDRNKCYTPCKAFGDMAEHITESLSKGSRVIVAGREVTEEWEANGERRSMNVLLVDAIGPDLRFATAKVERRGQSTAAAASHGYAPSAAGGSAGDPWASDGVPF